MANLQLQAQEALRRAVQDQVPADAGSPEACCAGPGVCCTEPGAGSREARCAGPGACCGGAGARCAALRHAAQDQVHRVQDQVHVVQPNQVLARTGSCVGSPEALCIGQGRAARQARCLFKGTPPSWCM
eukprot:scaffold178825_cov23-Tisochrysis_lutea.AAC.1